MNQNDLSRYERLKVIMEDWAHWSKGYEMRIGWPSRSIGVESGYVQSSTFEDLYDDMQRSMNRNVDAAVNDMAGAKKAAIYRCYGLASVFRFPRENYEQLLLDAHADLLEVLPKKGIAI